LYSDPVGFDHWDVINNAFEQGTYYNPEFRSANGVEQTTGYVADLITAKAVSWLDIQRDNDKPFFLIYNHKTPHRNWMPGPEELKDWDEDARIPEPKTLLRDMSGLNKARRQARMSIEDYMTENDTKFSLRNDLTPEQADLAEQAFGEGNRVFAASDLSEEEVIRWKYQRYIKTYLASVKSMDRQIGVLLDYLRVNDLIENTLIVYTSDQGFFLGENGWFDKRWMDEVSSRVPLLMQWPGRINPGTSTDSMVQNIDLAPTLLEAAAVVAPEPMHGVSLLPLATAEMKSWKRDLYYHFYENPGFHGVARHYGIHTGRYKLVHYYENDEWELFDLQDDERELVNLYGRKSHEVLTKELKGRLATLRAQYQVPEEDPEVPWYHGPLIRIIEQLLKLL
jgi:arylsulfatase A-like enzyme